MSFDVTPLNEPAAEFDFQAHRHHRVKVASVDARAKDVDSFAVKAATPSAADPRRPKYADPLRDVTDLAGIRVITFFPRAIEEVDRVVRAELDVVEMDDKGDALVL